MALKTNSASMVSIPAITLNALKGLLFNSKEGVDLSSIINDLSAGKDESMRDLTAINVGLVFNGLKPEIDKSTQYQYDYKYYYYRLDFVGYSLIEGTVTYNRTYLSIENGEDKEIRTDLISYPYGTHFDSYMEVTNKINSYLDKQQAEK